jgi:Putative Flp pilus-assembly TadE/G-like
MFAILLPVFLLGAAIVVDVGYWWANARKAQIAADACALAAARDIINASTTSWDRPECVHDGRDYVVTNLPAQSPGSEPVHVSTRVVWPFEGNTTQVEATVVMRVQTFFGRYVGLGGVELARRAVAEYNEGEGDYAIYARAPSCSDSLRFNGEDMSIDGLIHSNGEFTVDGEDFWAAAGTYNGPSGSDGSCSPDIDPGTLFGSPEATATDTFPDDVGFQPWPRWYRPAQFGWLSGCTYSGDIIEIDDTTLKIDGATTNHGGTLPSGVYCATDLFKIGGNGLSGTITALAPKIEVGGNDHDFTYFHQQTKVLFFGVPNTDTFGGNDGVPPDGVGVVCTHANEMNLTNGNNGIWRGTVFNPCGRVIVNGNNTSTIEGAIYARLVRINGGGFNMVGRGASGANIATALVQ